MKKLFSCLLLLAVVGGYGQDSYKDSMNSWLANYVENHEVVTGDAKQYFSFYPVDPNYRVVANFKKANNFHWFAMETSGTIKKTFRVYGMLRFMLNDTLVSLNVYQSQSQMNTDEFQNHLFLPFTDLTSGDETYTAGRYIDLLIEDIVDNKVIIDFNKAYNPYCAYVSGKYNCPLPPRENELPVAIFAGEKTFTKDRQE
jgi:uncharacterized protein (DUF1684 family)